MKRIILFACLIFLMVMGLLLARHPAPPAPTAPVVLLPMPYSMPPQRVSLFQAWVPRGASWAWLWRLKERIQGRPNTFDVAATLVDFTGSAGSVLTNHPLASPQFSNTAGLGIWLLDNAELAALRDDVRKTSSADILSVGRIITADRMEARLMSGNTVMVDGFPTSVGLAMDLMPHGHRDTTDLTTVLTYSEARTTEANAVWVQTNLAVAVRLQMKKGTGVFLLAGAPAAENHKRIGVILSVNPPAAKK